MAAVTLEVAYGHEVKGMEDPAVIAVFQVVKTFTTIVTAERASIYIAFPLRSHCLHFDSERMLIDCLQLNIFLRGSLV
jgi:hypothetical protein